LITPSFRMAGSRAIFPRVGSPARLLWRSGPSRPHLRRGARPGAAHPRAVAQRRSRCAHAPSRLVAAWGNIRWLLPRPRSVWVGARGPRLLRSARLFPRTTAVAIVGSACSISPSIRVNRTSADGAHRHGGTRSPAAALLRPSGVTTVGKARSERRRFASDRGTWVPSSCFTSPPDYVVAG
jgi:hypothetical protein